MDKKPYAIKFSHRYHKMPEETRMTFLLQAFICSAEELSIPFVSYDTSFPGGSYKLPRGKVLVLVLNSIQPDATSRLWTTVRRWTPSKHQFYLGLVDKQIGIEITGE